MKEKIISFLKIDVTRFLMRIFWVLPLKKNCVFFSAYEGKQYSCNPRAVFEKMAADPYFRDFEFIWELQEDKRGLIQDPRVKFVSHNSRDYFRAVLTSQYLITNSAVSGRVPVRKKQININTWHGGGAYKRVGFANNGGNAIEQRNLQLASAQTTHFLSSSDAFTRVMSESVILPPERFIPTGMPRNDVFFDSDSCDKLRRQVMERYQLDKDSYWILYAPTYRGAAGQDAFAFDLTPLYRLRSAVEKKTGKKAVLMIRMHYFSAGHQQEENAVGVSDYPDMQELLASVDMLVTDYSSSMWDFGLSGKPCLLYTPDLADYDLERGFYTPPAVWPGILCETEAALLEAVEDFDPAAYQARLAEYYRTMGSYDRGIATAQVLRIIQENP